MRLRVFLPYLRSGQAVRWRRKTKMGSRRWRSSRIRTGAIDCANYLTGLKWMVGPGGWVHEGATLGK